MLVSKRMVQEKDQARQLMLMGVFTKGSGEMIKRMVQEYFNILMEQDMMENGRMIFVMDLGHIHTRMGTNMKATGIMTFNKGWGLITT